MATVYVRTIASPPSTCRRWADLSTWIEVGRRTAAMNGGVGSGATGALGPRSNARAKANPSMLGRRAASRKCDGHTFERPPDVALMNGAMSRDVPAARRAPDTLADPTLRRHLEEFVRRRVA